MEPRFVLWVFSREQWVPAVAERSRHGLDRDAREHRKAGLRVLVLPEGSRPE